VKVEGTLFAAGVVFYGVVAVIYWFLSYEPVGTTALALSAGLAAMIGFYVLATAKRIGPRPEDRVDAEIDEAAGDFGFFSPHSWWPLPTALGVGVTFLGIIFGWWLCAIGAGILFYGVIGLVFEHYRGAHAH
jgi:Cytochrome c oxidase subunit IV